METFQLPTGVLFVDEYSRGKLETLSIGDYGKEHNVKANFLGYSRELNGVPNIPIKPLSEKWVITLSTQFGCPQKCVFCDVPNVKFNGNASFDDLKKQFVSAIECFPDVRYAERLNIHFARMGEPMFNENVLDFAEWLGSDAKKFLQDEYDLRSEVIHPVFTTSMPKVKYVEERLQRWCDIKNNLFRGQAGLQLSINSTDEEQRNHMFGNSSMSLEDIASVCSKLPEPIGRKYCLNFAYATGNKIDPVKIRKLFDPKYYMIKITPIHESSACVKNNIQTIDGYNSFAPYKDVEKGFLDNGYDVLVFIPSMDEENGIITCGNAILGGSKIRLQK
jgi:23S rRNA (adenine2503-C2)-methyltransferase